MLPLLPQKWSQPTCSRRTLEEALKDETITAIKADVIMGSILGSHATSIEPIITDSSSRISSLSLADFIHIATGGCSKDVRSFRKHIRLTFRELDAVDPTLKVMAYYLEEMPNTEATKTVFLHADVFPGPGKRDSESYVDPIKFVALCVGRTAQFRKRLYPCPFTLSLGFQVDTIRFDCNGYTPNDCKKLIELVRLCRLNECKMDVLLTLSARVLAQKPSALESIFEQFPYTQVIVVTGRDEIPIGLHAIHILQDYFADKGRFEQLGFDCCVDRT